MTRIKLVLEYDGTDFHGWQTQQPRLRPTSTGAESNVSAPSAPPAPPAPRTVQGELETALARLYDRAPAAPAVTSASRTDAGVHAEGQVAAFTVPDGVDGPTVEKLPTALNALLPDDAAVLRAEEVPAEFHPRRDARGKRYRYQILNRRERSALLRRRTWRVSYPLDDEALRAAAARFVGRRDFAPFAAKLELKQEEYRRAGREEFSTVREIFRCEVSRAGDLLTFEVEGDGFLYKMVRLMVGTLVEVGRGKQPPAWVEEITAGRVKAGGAGAAGAAGPAAPAHGLTLVEVFY